jgi:hypothetical protein
MRRSAAAFVVVVWLCLSAGCVERRMVIASDPPGALVLHNGVPIGNAPADDSFVYYGNHHFTLIRPGYATLQVDQRVIAPWYQWFPLDLFSEILLPYQLEDVRRFTYQMQPLPGTRPEEVSDRAAILRQRGKAIPTEPKPGQPAPPVPVPVAQPGAIPAPGFVPPGSAPAPPPFTPPAPPPATPGLGPIDAGGGPLGPPQIGGPG